MSEEQTEPESSHISYSRLTYEELTEGEFSKLHILRRVALESVWGLLEGCPVYILAKGATLLEQGQSNQTMYLVMDGRLSVHLDHPETEPVAFLEIGQTVGELSVIDDSPASAFVIASLPTKLLAIDESTFWRMVEVSHEFSTNMLLLLAGRLRANNSKIIEGLNQRLKLEHEATVDALTGLRNRRWLDSTLPRMSSRHRFSKKPLSMIMLDVDHFKKFNDNYGHAAGDRVLTVVAKTIAEKIRPTDLAARYGGEEFSILLPDTPLAGGIVAANRIREAVEHTEVVCADGRHLPPVTISLGVAEATDMESGSDTLGRADNALYQAKSNGRNRVET
ncbi:MAG: GGDEF domain-containing protein [Deltaproteobacteria bacterium]|nr:GGDEF domain-containing protein [Deltaproteobacteria bacterium]